MHKKTKEIILPKKDKDGRYYISYSQIKSWNSAKGFNTGSKGKYEYMRQYFFGEEFPSGPYAEFGTQVENYICERKDGEFFCDSERETLEKVKVLGKFQQEVKIEFDGYYLKGFVDDMDEDMTHIIDIKTCSEKSSKQYYEDDYIQLDIYAMWIKQQTGKLPKKLEVCMIERTGNAFRGGRDALKVGGNIWLHDRKTSMKRQKEIKEYIESTALDISNHYKTYLKLVK